MEGGKRRPQPSHYLMKPANLREANTLLEPVVKSQFTQMSIAQLRSERVVTDPAQTPSSIHQNATVESLARFMLGGNVAQHREQDPKQKQRVLFLRVGNTCHHFASGLGPHLSKPPLTISRKDGKLTHYWKKKIKNKKLPPSTGLERRKLHSNHRTFSMLPPKGCFSNS